MEFVIEGKTKSKRIFEEIKAKFEETGNIKLVGKKTGAVKAVALAEKIKSIIQGIDQNCEIFEINGEEGILIELKLV